MSNQEEFDPRLKKLESQLANATPSDHSIDPLQLMYQAGWEAGIASKKNELLKARGQSASATPSIKGRALMWPIATCVSTVVAVTLLVMILIPTPNGSSLTAGTSGDKSPSNRSLAGPSPSPKSTNSGMVVSSRLSPAGLFSYSRKNRDFDLGNFLDNESKKSKSNRTKRSKRNSNPPKYQSRRQWKNELLRGF